MIIATKVSAIDSSSQFAFFELFFIELIEKNRHKKVRKQCTCYLAALYTYISVGAWVRVEMESLGSSFFQSHLPVQTFCFSSTRRFAYFCDKNTAAAS
jgi:hypothetical protein